MKIYVVIVSRTDDDFNLSSTTYIEKSEDEMIERVRQLHEEELNYYSDLSSEVEDDYEPGHQFFEIYLSDNCDHRVVVEVEEKEI